MKFFFMALILLAVSLFADTKSICYNLTKDNHDFFSKLQTIENKNTQSISLYTTTNDVEVDTLKVDNNQLDICEYKYPEHIMSYLIYSNNDKVIFINNQAIKLTNVEQGLAFDSLSYKDNRLTIFYLASGGTNTNHVSYKYTFIKIQNDFKLITAIKEYSVEVSDGFDLKTQELTLKDIYLSNFDSMKYIEAFDNTNKYTIKQIRLDKQFLYETPAIKTKMYLVKGDEVEILEEKDDWLYILYKGKKDIKAWIPKSAIE
jgi:uncharacterized protein YegJ (DUF2314 family)